jgi:hypothetical protein
MSKGINIIGSARSDGKERESNDYYATDPIAIDKLIKYFKDNNINIIQDNDVIWENACGEGNLSKRLNELNYTVMSTDINNRGYESRYICGATNNFIENPEYYKYILDDNPKIILTNPPYKYAKEWVEKSLETLHPKGKLILLLKLQFLESIDRYKLFKTTPLKYILVFSKRLSCYDSNIKLKNSGLIAYAWYIWDKEYKGQPIVDWLL